MLSLTSRVLLLLLPGALFGAIETWIWISMSRGSLYTEAQAALDWMTDYRFMRGLRMVRFKTRDDAELLAI